MRVSLLDVSSGEVDPRTDSGARGDGSPLGRVWERARRWLTVGVFSAPTILAAIYFGLVASPRYESETEFIVRGISSSTAAPGLESLMHAFGISRSSDDSNVVMDYLASRQVLSELEAALPLRQMYGLKEADALSRFPRPFLGDSFEWLYHYYGDRVSAILDTDTGIVTVTAEAFRPEDAQAITRRLLAQAEALVNAMNARLEAGTVQTAETTVAEARKAVLETHDAVTRFRNAELVVDPAQNAIAQLTTISTLSAQVDQVLAQIAQTNTISPSSPSVAPLRAKADALAAQIASEQRALAGPRSAVADKVSAYERLALLRTLADSGLDAATTALTQARADARRQHVYLEVISAPNLPDESTQPRRIRSVATVFAVSCAAAAIWWLLTVGVREHGQ
ncbi:hypothetical protein [Roseiarcus fermentans]|nr:hypothetical protein [Roseiarcus fermentans]